MVVGLNALRVLAQVSAAEQIVGRERNHGACHRQLVRDVVASRRVNSNVIHRRYLKTGKSNNICFSSRSSARARRDTAMVKCSD